MLDLQSVSIERRGLQLIDDLSLTVNPGEILGISGGVGRWKNDVASRDSE
ncbi:MAG: hypothetical protein Q4P05_02500 [Actinomycetaceae bacterium]|nr:hypothetical protein [Actinomycetaceae bacterium]